MRRQAGISQVALVGVIAALAVGGVGFLAWQNMAQVAALRMELDSTKAAFDKTRNDLKKLQTDSSTAIKENSTLKVTAERMTAERDAVRATIEKEQIAGEQLRAELALAKEQVSYLSARTSKDVVRGMPKAPATTTKR